MTKIAINLYLEEKVIKMAEEMAKADDRKPSPWLNRLIKQEYLKFKLEAKNNA